MDLIAKILQLCARKFVRMLDFLRKMEYNISE